MLVNIYLDQILSNSHDNNDEQTRFDTNCFVRFILLNFRSKLQEFLIKSNSYRIHSVLSRINQTNQLKHEIALLYGKVDL
jgi:hypothetical protein